MYCRTPDSSHQNGILDKVIFYTQFTLQIHRYMYKYLFYLYVFKYNKYLYIYLRIFNVFLNSLLILYLHLSQCGINTKIFISNLTMINEKLLLEEISVCTVHPYVHICMSMTRDIDITCCELVTINTCYSSQYRCLVYQREH